MKKYSIPLIILMSIIYSCKNDNKQSYFEIDGTINADSGTIVLEFNSDYIQNKEDKLTVQVLDHHFEFSGYISEPQSARILYDKNKELTDDFVYLSGRFILDDGKQTGIATKTRTNFSGRFSIVPL